MPIDLLMAVDAGVMVEGYNVVFEFLIWEHVARRRYGWVELPFEQTDCTMLRTFAMSFPGRLEQAAHALAIDHKKDMAGHRKMLAIAKPRPKRKSDPDHCTNCRTILGPRMSPEAMLNCSKCYGTGDFFEFYTKEEKPEHYADTYKYCLQDVRVERAISKKVFRLSPSEQKLRHLDHKINRRGIFVDVSLVRTLIELTDMEANRLHEEIRTVSKNAIASTNARADIVKFLKFEGVHTDSIAKAKLDEMLEDKNLPSVCRKVLLIRKEAAKTSTKKLKTLLAGVEDDGRIRGLLQFLGARSTGRWAGRRFQPQNLPRPKLKQNVIDRITDLLGGVS